MFIYICITNSITYQHLKHLKLLIFKTRTLKKIKLKPYMWVWKSLSCVQLFATPWTVARQAPLSMAFPKQESWSGLPFPSPGHLPHPGIKPASPALAGGFFTTEPPGKSILKSLLKLGVVYSDYLSSSKWQVGMKHQEGMDGMKVSRA